MLGDSSLITFPVSADACDRVSTASRYDINCTMGRVREGYYRLTGEWCSEAQAYVACYSVPEGAPIAMAVVNVGPSVMDDAQAQHFDKLRSFERALHARGSKRP